MNIHTNLFTSNKNLLENTVIHESQEEAHKSFKKKGTVNYSISHLKNIDMNKKIKHKLSQNRENKLNIEDNIANNSRDQSNQSIKSNKSTDTYDSLLFYRLRKNINEIDINNLNEEETTLKDQEMNCNDKENSNNRLTRYNSEIKNSELLVNRLQKELNISIISNFNVDEDEIDNKDNVDTSPVQKGNYIMYQNIGEGAFGKVKKGYHIETKDEVAIKILDKTLMNQEEGDFIRVMKEITILKKLRHKNIVQLYEIIESSRKLYLVMEICDKELFDYIVDNQKLSEMEACKYFQELIDAVEYLHLQSIVHRDLKPENLLLDKNKTLKLTDFGLSTIYGEDLLNTPCGTPSYAPPEMLKGEPYHGMLSDLWSCGVILYAMVCGYLPFSESNEDLNCKNIVEGKFEIPNSLSPELINLLNGILQINPLDRYDITQVKEDPWFNMINPVGIPGIIIGLQEIPIDEEVIEIMLNEFSKRNKDLIKNREISTIENYENTAYNNKSIDDIEHNDTKPDIINKANLLKEINETKESIVEKIRENKFDNITAIYYLKVKQRLLQGIPSISDLQSDLFIDYITTNLEKHLKEQEEAVERENRENRENNNSDYINNSINNEDNDYYSSYKQKSNRSLRSSDRKRISIKESLLNSINSNLKNNDDSNFNEIRNSFNHIRESIKSSGNKDSNEVNKEINHTNRNSRFTRCSKISDNFYENFDYNNESCLDNNINPTAKQSMTSNLINNLVNNDFLEQSIKKSIINNNNKFIKRASHERKSISNNKCNDRDFKLFDKKYSEIINEKDNDCEDCDYENNVINTVVELSNINNDINILTESNDNALNDDENLLNDDIVYKKMKYSITSNKEGIYNKIRDNESKNRSEECMQNTQEEELCINPRSSQYKIIDSIKNDNKQSNFNKLKINNDSKIKNSSDKDNFSTPIVVKKQNRFNLSNNKNILSTSHNDISKDKNKIANTIVDTKYITRNRKKNEILSQSKTVEAKSNISTNVYKESNRLIAKNKSTIIDTNEGDRISNNNVKSNKYSSIKVNKNRCKNLNTIVGSKTEGKLIISNESKFKSPSHNNKVKDNYITSINNTSKNNALRKANSRFRTKIKEKVETNNKNYNSNIKNTTNKEVFLEDKLYRNESIPAKMLNYGSTSKKNDIESNIKKESVSNNFSSVKKRNQSTSYNLITENNNKTSIKGNIIKRTKYEYTDITNKSTTNKNKSINKSSIKDSSKNKKSYTPYKMSNTFYNVRNNKNNANNNDKCLNTIDNNCKLDYLSKTYNKKFTKLIVKKKPKKENAIDINKQEIIEEPKLATLKCEDGDRENNTKEQEKEKETVNTLKKVSLTTDKKQAPYKKTFLPKKINNKTKNKSTDYNNTENNSNNNISKISSTKGLESSSNTLVISRRINTQQVDKTSTSRKPNTSNNKYNTNTENTKIISVKKNVILNKSQSTVNTELDTRAIKKYNKTYTNKFSSSNNTISSTINNTEYYKKINNCKSQIIELTNNNNKCYNAKSKSNNKSIIKQTKISKSPITHTNRNISNFKNTNIASSNINLNLNKCFSDLNTNINCNISNKRNVIFNRNNSIKQSNHNNNKMNIRELSLFTITDISCIFAVKLSTLLNRFLDIMKMKRISYVKISSNKFKCSKSGVCFNTEIFKVYSGLDIIEDKKAEIGSIESKSNLNLYSNNEISKNNKKKENAVIDDVNDVEAVNCNDDYLNIRNTKNNKNINSNSNKDIISLENSTSKSSNEENIYYINFKNYSGDMNHYRGILKEILDLLEKIK